MKKLFAVLLAVAMLLSLGVTAFAADTGKIVVANAGETTYTAYKIFVATEAEGKIHYTVEDPIKSAIDDVLAKEETNKTEIEKGLRFIYNDDDEIEADAGFSAADFATWLISKKDTLLTSGQPLTTADDVATLENVNPGYYLVVPTTFDQTTVGALATVIPDRTTQVQNKNDMPLNKEVDNADADANYDDNGEGVNVGDTLNYKITTKTPARYKDNDYDYTFLVTDKMTDGLTFKDDLTITIGKKVVGVDDTAEGRDAETDPTDLPAITITAKKDGTVSVSPAGALNPAPLVKNTNSTGPMGPNEIRFDAVDSENGGNFIFEVSLAVASEALRQYTGVDVTITYSATVNDKATAQLLENTAVLTYGDDNNLIIKDAETDNYISRIVVDKFETGNRTQKLPGAEFRLYKQENANAPKQYYVLSYTTAEVPAVQYTAAEVEAWEADPEHEGQDCPFAAGDVKTPAVPASGAKVEWKTLEELTAAGKTPTVKTTDENGAAEFPYLEDGTYYLEEIKAPVDYTRLLGPIEIVVDGSASVDGRLTHQQRVDALTNVANVANNPGSSMPSTGGVGATMLTIGGVALILAAGAFLVLRRRKEQE